MKFNKINQTRHLRFERIKQITLLGALIGLLLALAMTTALFKIGNATFQITDGIYLALIFIFPGWSMLVVGVTYSMLIDILNSGFIFVPITILIHVLMFLLVKGFKYTKLKYLGIFLGAFMIYIYVFYSYLIYDRSVALNEFWVDTIQIGVTICLSIFLTFIFVKNDFENKLIKRYHQSFKPTLKNNCYNLNKRTSKKLKGEIIMQVNDLRPGTTFLYEGNIFVVIEQSFSKTGRQQGKVTVKVKNMVTGARVEITFTGGDKVEKAMIERKDMQYLYNDGNDAYLMDSDTYEQVQIPMDKLQWEANFLKEGLIIKMTEFEGEVLGVALPDKVELKIVEAEPAVKGDTTSGAQKKAKLETGLEIQVPLFVTEGTVVIINTADGKYAGRAQ